MVYTVYRMSSGQDEGRQTMRWNTVERLDADAIFGVKGTPTLDDVTRTYVEWVVTRNRGNKVHAAAALGVSRKSLYKMIERWQWADVEKIKAERLGMPMGTVTISSEDAEVVATSLGLSVSRVVELHSRARKRETENGKRQESGKGYATRKPLKDMTIEEAAG
jgi:DNA-binding protein Fis